MNPASVPRTLAVLAGLLVVTGGVFAQNAAPDRGHRLTPLSPTVAGRTGFARLSSEVTGVAFTNHLSALLALNNQVLENGAGVALGDVNGDGRCDVYLCGSESDNRLFLNQGEWKFADITPAAGVACAGQLSSGAVLADVDGDGDLDLLVNGIGVGTRLFLNDGQGRFSESNRSGLQRRGAATSMALADLDGDGDLDLYVCFYRTTSARGDAHPPAVSARLVQGELVVTPADQFFGLLRADGTVEVIEKGEPDVLYWNDGQGQFSAASWTNGTFLDDRGQPLKAPPEDWGLSVMLRDLNGDDAPDIYVCNDFFRSRDRLWLGDGQGRFRAASPSVLRGFPLSSMAVDVADVDRDGHDDVLVAEMLSRDHRTRRRQRANAPNAAQSLPITHPEFQIEHPRNVLQWARGDGTFADVGWLSGLAATDWTWNVAFLDVDLDGWEDLLVATGNAHDVLDLDAQASIDRAGPKRSQPALAFYPPLDQPNLAFRNNRNLTFTECGADWGFDARGVSQGMALGDLDGDGDLDVVVNNLNQEAWIYRNDTPAPRIAVRLHGQAPNTQGIGARIRVSAAPAASLPAQSQALVAGGRYLGSDDPQRSFASGSATNLTVEVRWRSGRASRISAAAPGQRYEVWEPAGPLINRVLSSEVNVGTTWFTNISAVLNHRHRENVFDDFARQPLLPNQLSAGGPGVTWYDVDRDGWDDLVVGAATGDSMALFRNNTRGGFDRVKSSILQAPLPRDMTTVLGWERIPGQITLLAGLANDEDGETNGARLREFDIGNQVTRDLRPARTSSLGPLALADVDGDGDLDLFEGGRVIPGRWPEPAASLLYRNEAGELVPDRENNPSLERLGLVSGAVFTDLDSDGNPDLAVAREWGSIKILRNKAGHFQDWDPVVDFAVEPSKNQQTLSSLTGLWTSVTAGDFDGDGRPDLILANWGRNAREAAFQDFQLWFGDFSGTGDVDLIEVIRDPVAQEWVPWRARDAFAQSMPWMVERYPTLRSFAAAGVAELLRGRPLPTGRLTLATTDSMILLNRGDYFAATPLPLDAQIAPAFGLAVADFNGDGREDLFVAQNFFRPEPETSRFDAGRGLVLEGDGRGGFHPVPGPRSGVILDGEQRGAAVADFDQDGRPDLVVGQNSGPTQLLLNQAGKPGLRLKLIGPPGNPTGVGASVRLHSGGRSGPAREIHSGSGYWSQDSPVVVLALPDLPTMLEVRWPGGRTNTVSVPSGTKSLEVRAK